MGNKLQKILKEKSWSKARLIQELETISVVMTENNKRLMKPLTKTQSEILKEFNLSEYDLRAYASRSI
jgi:hypothetical protein